MQSTWLAKSSLRDVVEMAEVEIYSAEGKKRKPRYPKQTRGTLRNKISILWLQFSRGRGAETSRGHETTRKTRNFATPPLEISKCFHADKGRTGEIRISPEERMTLLRFIETRLSSERRAASRFPLLRIFASEPESERVQNFTRLLSPVIWTAKVPCSRLFELTKLEAIIGGVFRGSWQMAERSKKPEASKVIAIFFKFNLYRWSKF